ncbi:MAG: hypothetical protein L6Q57_05750 [Alphaproteobacteria bacterium]|nr:hypothetical protein [Alphaproteobacteria bacterium]
MLSSINSLSSLNAQRVQMALNTAENLQKVATQVSGADKTAPAKIAAAPAVMTGIAATAKQVPIYNGGEVMLTPVSVQSQNNSDNTSKNRDGGDGSGDMDFDAFLQAFEAGDIAADYDQSGFVDLEDYHKFVEDMNKAKAKDEFLAMFEAGDIGADFDGSGFVDTDDYDAFVRAQEGG